MQVTANTPTVQELTLSNAVANGRSTKTVSKDVFGSTRKPDTFQHTFDRLTTQKQTYSPEHLKKMHLAKMQSATQATGSASLTVAGGNSSDQTQKTVQFTQNDVEMLLKLFGSSEGDGNYMSHFDLDNSGTIDLDDLNAMLSQIASSQQPEQTESPADQPLQYTQEDIDLLTAAFGAQVGDENYSEALDLDGDGIIGLDDLNLMLSSLSQSNPVAENPTPSTIEQLIAAFGTSQGENGFVAELDLNSDGTVNLDDLNAMLNSL